ncbi:CCN family member 4 isoform X2 [Physeter macrocephalus]|uniref:CCN family member 4 n=1 Tax=Physeter macrocephalus TaxID=9755 RepID=A0A2Y9EQX7_PHYMC|nr:CCN family member 4 isoform X2 [Physeter catodon]|eukprot:XP_007106494.1 WNT1-inducible-signaling pathway protein 1 isoform X2 [Physeter catodon]
MKWLLPWTLVAVTAVEAVVSTLAMALSPAPTATVFSPAPLEDTSAHPQFCKWPCECPPSAPRCPLGVSLITDGCECCKVCAQQLGDNCTEAAVCDPHRGLYCDYSGDSPRYAVGVCAPAVDEIEPWHRNCIAYSSPWSPCSASCGLGVSTRISNVNARCWPEQESRLCDLRPCDMDLWPHVKEGKKCLAVYQPEAPVNFTLAGCTSTRSYRPKYCGVCTDNRCCIPYKSKTIDIAFQCPDGPGFSRQALWINACFCNLSCRNPNDIFADLDSYPDFSEIAN